MERQRLGVAYDQRVAQAGGKNPRCRAESVRYRGDVGVQGAQCFGGEGRDFAGGAEAGAHLGELAGDFGGLDSGLGVLGAGLAFPGGGAVPFLVQAGAFFQADALERELFAGCVAEQESFEDGLDDVVAAVGYRDGDAQRLADLLVLAQQHVQDDPVDAVVGAVQRDRADDVSALAEPVDPAFALFVAGRVPRQVVVDDSLEVFLQVHAFGQAVGRDEHRPPRVVAGQFPDPRLALVRRKHTGDGGDRVSSAETLGQMLSDVFRGVDEPAEDHRVIPLEQQPRDHLS